MNLNPTARSCPGLHSAVCGGVTQNQNLIPDTIAIPEYPPMTKTILHPLLTGLFLSALPSFAGDRPAGKAPVPPPAPVPAANPLSFFGGKLVLDIEERLRFEARENNFDFNDSVDSLTDDSWLLQRVRFGALFAPTSFLKFYAQGQDTREFIPTGLISQACWGRKGTTRPISARRGSKWGMPSPRFLSPSSWAARSSRTVMNA